jgi:hypothetical protein
MASIPNLLSSATKDTIKEFERLAEKRWGDGYIIVSSPLNVEGWGHISTKLIVKFDDSAKHIYMDLYLDSHEDFVFDLNITHEEYYDGAMIDDGNVSNKFQILNPPRMARTIIDNIKF